MTEKESKKILDEILDILRKSEDCIPWIVKGVETLDEFCSVLKDDPENSWLVWHCLTTDFIMKHREAFALSGIYANENRSGGCGDNVTFCDGEGTFRFRGSFTVIVNGKCTIFLQGGCELFCENDARCNIFVRDSSEVHDAYKCNIDALDQAKIYDADSCDITARDLVTVTALNSKILGDGSAHIKAENSEITLCGSSSLEAYDCHHIVATDRAVVEAKKCRNIAASGNSAITCEHCSDVEAQDNSVVYAHKDTEVQAGGCATVFAYGLSKVIAAGTTCIYAKDKSEAYVSGRSFVRAYDYAHVEANENATVVAIDYEGFCFIEDRAVFINKLNGEIHYASPKLTFIDETIGKSNEADAEDDMPD